MRKLSRSQAARVRRLSWPALEQAKAERDALIRELREEGWQLPELAELLGAPKQRIHERLRATEER